jgi:2-dehydro-3-deoxygalactonokinase
VEAGTFNVLASESSDKGILATFNAWNETGKADPSGRLHFYLHIISEHITEMEKRTNRSLDGVPLVISGMASSSIGMMPLPYQPLPFAIDGSGLVGEYLKRSGDFEHDILIISGISSSDDVMRGEETQLIGLTPEDRGVTGNQLFILPGTHSKHIVVNAGKVIAFKTYMTGEFFDLLSKKSILHSGLENDGSPLTPQARNIFEQAVRDNMGSSLLNSCFRVRTNILFDKLSKKDNYHYLSGLLIGAELGEIVQNDTIGIYLCCGAHLKWQYEAALQVLGLNDKVHSFPAADVEKAAWKGQYKIYEKYIKR